MATPCLDKKRKPEMGLVYSGKKKKSKAVLGKKEYIRSLTNKQVKIKQKSP